MDLRVEEGKNVPFFLVARKSLFLAVFFFISMLSTQSIAKSCYEKALTQEDLDACVYTDLRREEMKLQTVYDQLLEKVSSRGEKALLVAQETWQAYRDAQCAFNTLGSTGGTIHPFSIASCKLHLTELQIKILREELTCEEGVVTCGGQ